jgi:hypothetical protein
VKNFGGGFTDTKHKKYFRVIHQNGIQSTTKKWFLFRKHPKVKKGDRVSLYYLTKAQKNKEVKPVDWDKLVSRLLALFTTVALVQSLGK